MVLGGQPPGRVGRRRFLQKRAARAALFVPDSLRRRPRCWLCRASPDRARAAGARARATGGCVTNSAPSPSSANGLIVNSGSVAGLRLELDELGRLLEPDQRVGEPVRRVAELRREPVGRELALRRDEQVHERRRDRPEHEEQRALEPAADPARLERARPRPRRPPSAPARRGAGRARARARARPRARPARQAPTQPVLRPRAPSCAARGRSQRATDSRPG